MSTNAKKTYDTEFKKQAVQLLTRSGRPLAQITRELGVDAWALRDWKKRFQPELAQQPETLEAMRVRIAQWCQLAHGHQNLNVVFRKAGQFRRRRDIKTCWKILSPPTCQRRQHQIGSQTLISVDGWP